MRKALYLFVLSVCLQACGDQGPQQDALHPPASSRLSELLSPEDREGYALALEPRRFVFPEDHGAHPVYRNEWWYVTGNLDAVTGERFGFELTIFRFALSPTLDPTLDADPAPDKSRGSAWRTNQVYIGHFAVTDVDREAFYVAERYARGALGLAGAGTDPFRVWVEDWQIGASPDTPGQWFLQASDADASVSLTLEPLKPPVLNGEDGLSQKSSEPGNASYYYSMPRLRTEGRVTVAGTSHRVSGLAWLDREWGSSALSHEQSGWDWFALQLDDGSDLMFYQLRRTDGTIDAHSAGTFIPADGSGLSLAHDEVQLRVRDSWDSPEGGTYPMGWTLTVPRLALELQVEPVLEGQELQTTVRYWEGAVDVSGNRGGQPVTGRGYVELTGYAD